MKEINEYQLDNNGKDNKIIAIIGSSKYKDEILKAGRHYNLLGYTAIHSDVFSHSDNFELSKELLDTMIQNGHNRIDMADYVFVVNKNGYIGESTKEEIQYAKSKRKRIIYLEEEFYTKYGIKVNVKDGKFTCTLKVFVSVPMNNRDDNDIADEMDELVSICKDVINNNREKVLELLSLPEDTEIDVYTLVSLVNVYEDPTINIPMKYLSKSIGILASAQVAIFSENYESSRGCLTEYDIATRYGVPIIIKYAGEIPDYKTGEFIIVDQGGDNQ